MWNSRKYIIWIFFQIQLQEGYREKRSFDDTPEMEKEGQVDELELDTELDIDNE